MKGEIKSTVCNLQSAIRNLQSAILTAGFLSSFAGFAWAQNGATRGGEVITSFLPIILIIGVFYFLVIRPQRQKERQHQEMLKSIKKGDEVVTTGGIHGVIMVVKDETLIIKVGSDVKGSDVKLEISRSAIGQKKGGQP
ncbi:MAG: preprotein translocase subunit YajC [bacterium]|nr:preprotein translocase subunit YajC [bacterium]